MTLANQIANARAQVRKMKKVAPYIYPEWQALQQAKAEHAAAVKRLKAAQKAWREFGSKP